MDKRGLSAVITTVIIILLVMVSTGIIWVVIKNLVVEGSEEISFGRFVFDLSIKRAYMSGTDVWVSVRRSPGGGDDLIGINLIFSNRTDSIVIEKTIALRELEERTFVFTPAEVPGIGAGDEVSVAPIYLSDSGREKLGDITDTEEIGDSPPAGVGEGEGPCTSDCDGKSCGNDGCGGSCGFCVDSICSLEGQCVECMDNSHCLSGYYCSSANSCLLDTPLNSGTISTVWPPSARIYFDSVDLPLVAPEWWDPVNEDRYIGFDNSSESRCILIFDFIESAGIDPGDYSYIRLGVSPQDLPVNIVPNDNYEVWRTNTCGVTS